MDETRPELPSTIRQGGFSLVELMVALLIGLVIILGAGQLFLVGFQNFRKIEELSDKQAAITFIADTLLRDIRRADLSSSLCYPGDDLSFSVGGECHAYSFDEMSRTLTLTVGGDTQPLVNHIENLDWGMGDDCFADAPDDLICIDVLVENEKSSLRFHAMNRSAAAANY